MNQVNNLKRYLQRLFLVVVCFCFLVHDSGISFANSYPAPYSALTDNFEDKETAAGQKSQIQFSAHHQHPYNVPAPVSLIPSRQVFPAVSGNHFIAAGFIPAPGYYAFLFLYTLF